MLLSINKGLEHWNLDLEAKRLHGERKRQRGNDFFRRANYRCVRAVVNMLVVLLGLRGERKRQRGKDFSRALTAGVLCYSLDH